MRLATLILIALASPAAAQTCLPHAEAQAMLLERYGETVAVMGLTRQGQLMEVYTGPAGGWTLLFVSPDGQACLGGDGYDLQIAVAVPGVTG